MTLVTEDFKNMQTNVHLVKKTIILKCMAPHFTITKNFYQGMPDPLMKVEP